MPTTLALAVLSFLGTSDALWRMNCGVVQTGRVDAIASLGKASNHIHQIDGPSSIDLKTTYDDLQASQCTQCEVQADKSGYWTPQLFYEHSDGMYEEVDSQILTVSYVGGDDDVANIKPFPPGFRMISGEPSARSYDTSAMTNNGNRPITERVSFSCHDEQSISMTPDMNHTQCRGGMKVQVHFQSCWDGRVLYKEDNSHVAYMSGIDNGVCPATHPVQLMHISLEVAYAVHSVEQDGGQFVFALGDTTGKHLFLASHAHIYIQHLKSITDNFSGYGFYGGFLNGWDTSVQAAAITQCATGNPSGAIQSCPPLAASSVSDYAHNCPSPNAAADATSPALPGEYFSKKELRSRASGPVIVNNVGSYVFDGCFAEGTTGRALNGSQYLDTNHMTVESCVNYCEKKGFGYAGVEYAQECHCGSQIVNGGVMVATSQCNMTCKGNASEICGASLRLCVYLSG